LGNAGGEPLARVLVSPRCDPQRRREMVNVGSA
jgi:hypothetical protein